MELILHMGLAKTGSTFLQRVFHHNRESFQQAGLHYCSSPGDVAAHPAADAALVGQFEGSSALVQEAARSDCARAVLSSEDFGALIFRPHLFLNLIQALFAAGAEKIRIVIFIRRQDEVFWGLCDTLSRILYVDTLSTFYEIMRCGYFAVNETHRQSQAPYYCFCFDHQTLIGRFADQIAGKIPDVSFEVHDFDTCQDFPGAHLLSQLGVLDSIQAFPGEQLQNRRRPDAEVVTDRADAFVRVVGDDVGHRMRKLIEARATVPEDQKAAISSALMQRYYPGNAMLLQRFGAAQIS